MGTRSPWTSEAVSANQSSAVRMMTSHQSQYKKKNCHFWPPEKLLMDASRWNSCREFLGAQGLLSLLTSCLQRILGKGSPNANQHMIQKVLR